MRNRRSALRWSSPRALTKSRRPSAAATPKYGVDPRASRLACSSRASGSPTRAIPSAIAEPLGRRFGPPNATTEAEPTNQPRRNARSASNEIGLLRNWATARASTATQPMRRHRRLSHGAAAVTVALAAARPKLVGKSLEQEAVELGDRVGRVGRKRIGERGQPARHAAAAATVISSRQRRWRTNGTRPATSMTTAARRAAPKASARAATPEGRRIPRSRSAR